MTATIYTIDVGCNDAVGDANGVDWEQTAMEYRRRYNEQRAEIDLLRAALENARRDIFSLAPKQDSRSPLRKVAEAAAARIEEVLTKRLSEDDDGFGMEGRRRG